jgi:hypothetical protein
MSTTTETVTPIKQELFVLMALIATDPAILGSITVGSADAQALQAQALKNAKEILKIYNFSVGFFGEGESDGPGDQRLKYVYAQLNQPQPETITQIAARAYKLSPPHDETIDSILDFINSQSLTNAKSR